MAIKVIKREWSPCQLDYVKTFLLHSEKDVKDLPKCCVGSKATVSETDNEYYCTADGWKLGSELEGNTGGGSSGGGGSASAGGGLFNVNCDMMGKFPTEDPEKSGWFNVEGVTFDKTYDEIVAAVKSGAFAVVDAVNFMNQSNMLFRMPFVSYTADNAEFVVRAAGVDLVASVHADGSASFKFYSTDF